MRRLLTSFAFVAAGIAAFAQVRPTLPEELGLLEGPDRDDWQQPDQVMDRLGISDGSKVADIGAGGGWFTVRLARRVGPNGVVYAEDIQKPMIESIARRVKREGLANVKTILGTVADPGFHGVATNLQAVLMVDTYTQVEDPVALLKRIVPALAPGGKLGIVDFKTDGAGGPGPVLESRLNPETIKAQANSAGLTLLREESFLRYQYFLIFVKSEVKSQK
jgi:ubiquinone/menaquinone biosynthesis C-methylase UbiE